MNTNLKKKNINDATLACDHGPLNLFVQQQNNSIDHRYRTPNKEKRKEGKDRTVLDRLSTADNSTTKSRGNESP